METPKEKIIQIIDQQRAFFQTQSTKNIEKRIAELQRLKELILLNEKRIAEALFQDLHKSHEESSLTEIALVISEINYHIKHLKKWSRPQRVKGALFTFPGQGYIQYEPYGVVLIIAPWNYPFQLLLSPLVGAMAAGNCVILKPSPQSAHTSSLLAELFEGAFAKRYISVIEGDKQTNQALLAQRFDYIFFTGGINFGRYVAECAARYLTPITLELGGKSPCIVSEYADINLSARRIVWGKLLNAGQTCIAPDYLLVHKSKADQLIKTLKKYIIQQFDINPSKTEYYPHIISSEALQRLESLLDSGGEIIFGRGINRESLCMEPTIILNPDLNSRLMTEEIFGPIIPIITYDRISEAIQLINNREKPLALYYFGSKKEAWQVVASTSSGGMCINDTIMHIVNRHLPFGGVGQSGMGRYHGKKSFKTFSNPKSIYQGSTWMDMKMKYAPYKIPAFLKRFI